MTMILWHNPRCSKSRQTLALLTERGLSPEIRLYLDDAPDANEVRATLSKLGLRAIDMMRPKEADFKTLGLSKDDPDDRLVAAMATHPKLIERPVLIHGDKAALGRPPENVLTIL